MAVSGGSLLTVAGVGWDDKREIRVGSVRADWRVNGAGTLSALLPVDAAWRQGLDSYLGTWVRWQSRAGRYWGGAVRDVAVRFGNYVELSCSTFVDELKTMRARTLYKQASATAGTLARRAITDAPGQRAIFTDIEVDDSGPLFGYEARADKVFQIIDRVARSSGMQYTDVTGEDWSRTFLFREKVGTDLRGRILYVEGRHFGEGSAALSTRNMVNNLLAKSADRDWVDAPGAIVRSTDSIETYGESEDVRRYYGVHSKSGLAAKARAELATLAAPLVPLSFAVRNDDPQLAEIDQGDTIGVCSWSANAQYDLVITSIVDNEDTGETTITGAATEAAA